MVRQPLITKTRKFYKELSVLQSIYGDDAIRTWNSSTDDSNSTQKIANQNIEAGTIRYEARLT